ncbi:aldo/keto reductase [Dactylosporangium sp. NPDC051541]|uniref:aldo/keto reductase n=1 Tax=Dactylosporangium sp. NPDC051541 TaxID=3363977 RepID=UPI0037B99734
MKPGDRVPLGRTDLTVTRLGLGLASIGGLHTAVPAAAAQATVDAAWRLGVRLFDTAPVYGYGRSERRTGQALHNRPRAEYVLCTKVGRLIETGGPDGQPIWADPPPGLGPRLDYTADGVYRSLADSLDRLGLDRVDVLHIHDPELDYAAALGTAYPALDRLRRSGRIAAVSLGVNHADVAARFIRDAPEPGVDCVLLAGRYTLLDRSGAAELLPLCAERGVAIVDAGVYQGGLLLESQSSQARRVRAACARHDVPLLAAAVQFPFRHPVVAAVLVGARSAAEIEQSAALLEHPVPAALWDELDHPAA